MNAQDILFYGHKTLMKALEGFSREDAEMHLVTRKWNVRDLVAHLWAYETVLEDVLSSQLIPTEVTESLNQFRAMNNQEFNDFHYEEKKFIDYEEVLAELNSSHEHVLTLVSKFTPKMLSEAGTIPWYGPQYSIDDFIVYNNYGHKREHAAQIMQLKVRLKSLKRQPSKKTT